MTKEILYYHIATYYPLYEYTVLLEMCKWITALQLLQ